MGSRHRALLITTGGGEKLQEAEKDRHQQDLLGFLRSQGVDEDGQTAAMAHFDMGYHDGYTGETPFYGEDWDTPMGGSE